MRPVPRAEIDEELQRARDSGRRDGEQIAKWRGERAERDLAQIKLSVEKFEQASGLRLDGYNGEHLGKAVALLRARSIEGFVTDLERLRNSALQIANTIGISLDQFKS